jgi:ATP-binding cassette subfamily B protein
MDRGGGAVLTTLSLGAVSLPPVARSTDPPSPAQRGWLRRLAPWLRPHRRNVILAFGGALVGSLISAATPVVEREVLDNVILVHRSSLTPWVIVLVAFAAGGFGAAYLRRYRGGRVSLDVQFDLRNAVFDRLSRLDFARHDEMQTGQLVSRANSDLALLQGLLSFLPIMTGNILLLVASTVIMFVLSPLLATISLVAVPGMLITAYRMRRQTFPANWYAQQKEGEVAVLVEEAVTGVRVVKGFGQEEREVERLVERASELYGASVRATRLQARYQPVLTAIPQFAQVAVLALGGYLAIHHEIPLGTFLAFATYLVLLSAPARMLAVVLLVAQQARAGAERVFDILASTPIVTDHPGAAALPRTGGQIAFDGVRFGYLSSEPVLDGFDLTIRPGETVALVGASGSGKSTAALLLPRFYDVQAGSIRVDGRDVRDVTMESLRSQIGMVFEESFLFSDTVGANIAYGRPDASDAEVEAAARMAEAHGFIAALPEGYGTVVGERGLSLSGGQRQRIALARALLTDPRILILDDATSAIDARIEEEIHATLRRVMEGRTTLLVAHRRSTLRLADRIVVVDGGRVVDEGTHEDLSVCSATYRMLLAGLGDAVEGPAEDEVLPGDLDEPLVGGITPSLWSSGPPGGLTVSAAATGRTAAGAGNWMGSLAATPDLLSRVAALPPIRDGVDVDVDAERVEDPHFSLRRLMRPYRRSLLLGLLLVALDAVAGLAGPILIRSGLDDGVSRGSIDAVWVASGLFLVITAADLVDEMAETFVTGRTANRLLLALRVRVWSQLQRLSIDFYEQEMGGRIMTRMTTDVDAFSTLLESGLINALVSGFTFVGIGVALLVWNWQLAALSLTVVIPLAYATAIYRRRSADAYGRARERIAVVNANMQESLSGVREVQAYGRQERNEHEFHRLAGRYLRARLGAQRLIAVYFPLIQLLSDSASIVVLGVGSVLIADRSLSAGELIGFLLYLDLFFAPIQQLSQTFDSYQQAGASRAQIAALMRRRTLTPGPAAPVAPERLEGRLRFEGVRFAYPGAGPDGEALRGVDLEVRPGETVALVGETGAGKSTIIKLVTRFYDPTGGRVLADGIDLRDIDLPAYRHQLGYVPQEAHLFSGSIRDNIAYGRPDASDAEVEAAARRVGAHEFVAGMRGGYLAWVSERGRSLSSGQRQLIALARAELVDPAILLLDEATSNLDLATEARVSAAMSVVAEDRTTVLIAHRLQTAQRADRVVVMEAGRVAEDGTHDDLVAAGGLYARMWEAFEMGAGRSADADGSVEASSSVEAR